LFGSLRWQRSFGAVQASPHILRVASFENGVQYAAAGTEAPGYPMRSVMIKVVPLHVAKVWIAEIVVVRRVVDPLFGDIRLESAGYYHRSGESWKDENANQAPYYEQRQHVAQFAAHVITVKGMFVMPEMKRVEILIRQARDKPLVPLLRYFEMSMKNIAVREILYEHPNGNST
jgi:hypothetical protein